MSLLFKDSSRLLLVSPHRAVVTLSTSLVILPPLPGGPSAEPSEEDGDQEAADAVHRRLSSEEVRLADCHDRVRDPVSAGSK